MSDKPFPPRHAVWLLERLLPMTQREHVIGDLLEEFEDSLRRKGPAPARRLFWKQTLAALVMLIHDSELSERSQRRHKENAMSQFLDDVRHAGRGIRRSPGFAIVCAVTLGLGIGSAAAMLGIVERVVLHGPDDVVAPQNVFRMYATVRHPPNELETGSITSYIAYAALREGAHDLDGVGGYQASSWIVGRGVDAVSLPGVAASFDFFTTLGVKPFLGRFYSAAEDDPRSPHDVTVLSYEYWIRAFGGDRDVLGRQISIAFRPFTIIGVARRGFTGSELARVDYWIPLSAGAHPRADWPTTWRARWVQVVGRVKPGISVDRASREATAILRTAYTGTDANWRALSISFRPISFTSDG